MTAASEEAQADRDYWNDKYDDEPECEFHGADEMMWDPMEGEYFCGQCFIDDEWLEIEKNG